MNKNCGVYLIVSPSNGRYVGSSKNLKKRFNRYKNLSCGRQKALFSSFKKYGFENHKITMLIYCDEKELLFWERIFGDLYLALAEHKDGLNLRLPGYDDVPQSLTEEMRQIIRDGCKKRWDRPEERIKTSERAKRAMQNPELREKMRTTSVRQWDADARKRKSDQMKSFFIDNPDAINESKRKTKEFLLKNPDIKEKNYSKLTEFYKNNPNARSEMAKNRYINKLNPKAKRIINTETGEIYKSSKAVADLLGVNSQTVRNWVSGISKNNTPYKYL